MPACWRRGRVEIVIGIRARRTANQIRARDQPQDFWRDRCNLLSLTVGVALIDIIKIFEFVLPDDNLYATSGSLTYLVSAFFAA
jgi:hypothetical protein